MDENTASVDEILRSVARARRLATALLRGAAAGDIDDVLQDASVAALTTKIPPDAPLASWVRGIVRRISLLAQRRRVRRAAREEKAAAPLAQPSAAELAQRLARHHDLLAAVEALSDPIRAAIVRRYLDEVPPRAIAKELGVPLATVKTRLRRGLAQLRERLNREWGEELGAALVQLAGGGGAAALAGGGGVVLMSAKVKALLAAAAGVVVVASAVLVATRSKTPPAIPVGQAHESIESAAAEVPPPASVAAARTPSTMPTTVRPDTRSLRERLGEERVVDLEGRVVDEDARPVAGAIVTMRTLLFESIGVSLRGDDPTNGPVPRTATSGDDGAFRFPDIVRGEMVELEARTADGRYGRVARTRAMADEITTILLRASVEFRGIVVDAHDDRPVAGAVVRRLRSGGSPRRETDETVSDGNGEFTLRDLGDKSPLLVAIASDGRVSGFAIPEQSRGSHGEVRIPVGLAEECRGTVVDAATGRPLEGATIGLEAWGAQIAVRSRSDGSFLFAAQAAVERDEMPVLVTASGYVPVTTTLHCSNDPEVTTSVTLKPGGVARGRVVARDGTPLRGALLLATRDPSKPGGLDRVFATSEADGWFELSGFDPDVRHVLLVRHPECERTVVPFPSAADGAADVDLGTIRVGRGALVSGVVTDESGAAIAGCPVGLDAGGNAQRAIECDSKGRFEFAGVSAGRVHLTASAARHGYTRNADALLEVEDEAIVSATLVMPAGLTIAGRVVDPEGGGVADCSLVLERPTAHLCQRVGATDTDADGRFCFRGLDPANLELAVSPRRGGESRLLARRLTGVAAGAPELTIALEEGGFVSGRVVDGASLPMAKACVTAFDAAGAVLETARTADDGAFRILVARSVDLRLEVRFGDAVTPIFGPNFRKPAAAIRDPVQADDPPVEITIERN